MTAFPSEQFTLEFTNILTSSMDSQLTEMKTAVLRPSAPSHQNSALFSLAAVNTQMPGLCALTAPPSGEHWSVLTPLPPVRPGGNRFSVQPELTRERGHCTEKRSPAKICLLLGVRIRAGGGGRSGGEKEELRMCR